MFFFLSFTVEPKLQPRQEPLWISTQQTVSHKKTYRRVWSTATLKVSILIIINIIIITIIIIIIRHCFFVFFFSGNQAERKTVDSTCAIDPL